MRAYETCTFFLMRLLGQVTPLEVSQNPSSCSKWVFLVQSAFLLLTVGAASAYIETSVLVNVLFSPKKATIAFFAISGLSGTFTTFSFCFIICRNIKKSVDFYRFLDPKLKLDKMFTKGEQGFRLSTYIILIMVLIGVVYSSKQDLSEITWIPRYPGLIVSITSQVYSLLFATKLVYLTRHVKYTFRKANWLLSTNLSKHRRICRKDELDVILKMHYNGRDYLDLVNSRYGPEFAVILFYMYMTILDNLYNAALASGLFTKGSPDSIAGLFNFNRAIINIMVALFILWNGSQLAGEENRTTEIVWDILPKINCIICRNKISIFASHLSHLQLGLTAMGIFKLNMKTFSNIVASVATQLVILISLGSN